MKYELITDTHFNHKMLIEKGFRPANYESMLWRSIGNINEGSTLVHLGDIAMKRTVEVSEDLTGMCKERNIKTVLVLGNHDVHSINWYLEHGWDFVCESFTLEYMGKAIIFSHEPMPLYGKHTLNIHGHFHGNDHRLEDAMTWYSKETHVDVAPELTGYQVISLDQVLKGIK